MRDHFLANLFVPLLSLALALSGCGDNTSSSLPDSSPSEDSSTHGADIVYDPDNFVFDTQVVQDTKLRTYPGPSLMESSKDVQISVNGESLFVYETLVNHGRVFSWIAPTTKTQAVIFDFEGQVHLDVTLLNLESPLTSALIRPLAFALPVSFTENTISFDLNEPGNYVLEYNDDSNTAIHIFANRIEENPMTAEEAAKDPNMIYVGPGIYNAGAFPIKDNTTIYLAGGAYVYGQFSAEGCENVTIKGRGIVSGSIYSRASSNEYKIPVVMRWVNHLVIEDIAFFDPAGWALHLWKCDDVTVRNVKIITARSNGDGISVQSCSNVEVDGGYVRTWDDSLVVKNSDLGSTSHIHIHDVVVWTDLAQSMEVGYETYGPTMDDIIFEDITVIHNFHKALISMHNCDQAVITNVKYKNITLEDGQMLGDNRTDGENDFLIDFTIAYNAEWTKSGGKRGSIKGVTIENVKVLDMKETISARMLGDEEGTNIEDVAIKGLQIKGKQITSPSDLKLAVNDHVKNVTFETMEKVTGSIFHLPYTVSDSLPGNITKDIVPGVSQEGLLVPKFAYYQGEPGFIGVKAAIPGTVATSHGAGTKTSTPVDDGSGDYVTEGHGGNLAFDNDANTYYESAAWKNEESEFAGITYNFDTPTNVGVLRVFGDKNNAYSLEYSIQVWARRYKTDGTMNSNFTRLLTTKAYEMSPASGNYIDINLPTQDFGGLQLRLVHTFGLSAPEHYRISEIEFYPPSLTYGKAIVDASEHNDVYPVGKVVDGDPTGTSYYESKDLPAHLVIDLDDVYHLSKLVLCLPPILTWSTRVQNIEVLVSDSNLGYDASATKFVTAVEATDYTFDPQLGNRVIIDMNDVACRYLKLVINSNSATGGYGGQLSEVSAYGTK